MSVAGVKLRTAALALGLAAVAPPACPLDLHVDAASGSDGADGASWATALATVREAVARATGSAEADTVLVAEGTYAGGVIIPADVALLGGHPPGGGARDPSRHRTIITGEVAMGALVYFPANSDRSILDGFVVRDAVGSAVVIVDSAPVVRDCVIEDNDGTRSSGVIVIAYTVPRTAARVERTVVQRNTAPPADPITQIPGAVIAVDDRSVGMDLGTVLLDDVIQFNRGDPRLAVAVSIRATARIANTVIRSNDLDGVFGQRASVRLSNVEVSDNAGQGVGFTHFGWFPGEGCGGPLVMENVTVAGNRGRAAVGLGESADCAPGSFRADIVNSIVWNEGQEIATNAPDDVFVTSSIVEGGWTTGMNIIDADPLFVTGPLSDYYLSDVGAGQATTSPGIDAGTAPATTVGLDTRTTRTDGAVDLGIVDLGYHPIPVTSLSILRGNVPDGLLPHRVVGALPFVDDTGTLSDRTLPRLFYRVGAATIPIIVRKDGTADAPLLEYVTRR